MRNPFHNILECYKVLVQVRFTTSKTGLGMEYNKFYIRLASPAAERLMTYGTLGHLIK